MKTVYMMIGTPGSGKSYKAKEIAESTGAGIVSLDAVREEMYGNLCEQGDGPSVYRRGLEKIEKLLGEGRDVVYDATNVKRRKNTIETLKHLGADEVVGIYVSVPIKTCLKNNLVRNDRDVPVPEEVIRGMDSLLKANPPSKKEGFDRIEIIHPFKEDEKMYYLFTVNENSCRFDSPGDEFVLSRGGDIDSAKAAVHSMLDDIYSCWECDDGVQVLGANVLALELENEEFPLFVGSNIARDLTDDGFER